MLEIESLLIPIAILRMGKWPLEMAGISVQAAILRGVPQNTRTALDEEKHRFVVYLVQRNFVT